MWGLVQIGRFQVLSCPLISILPSFFFFLSFRIFFSPHKKQYSQSSIKTDTNRTTLVPGGEGLQSH